MTNTENRTADETVSLSPKTTEDIKSLILTVRDKQVLLDSDVARLYCYEVKRINEAAGRNIRRFPPAFRFQLTSEEYDAILKSQSAASRLAEEQRHGGKRKLPFVYTEQGIGMLSGLLRNETAIQVSIGIMNAFVEMRQFINANNDVFSRLVCIDNKIDEHDRRFDEVFDLLHAPETSKQSIFYKGQFYDAFALIIEIIQKAKFRLVIIDNYTNNTVLDMLTNKNNGVEIIIITSNPKKLGRQHLERFRQQYGITSVVECRDFHDRFIIIDDKDVYAVGASLKDVGKKCFEVTNNKDTSRFIEYVNDIFSIE